MFRLVVAGCGWMWLVSDVCSWLWLVVAGYGRLWLVVAAITIVTQKATFHSTHLHDQ